MNVSVCIPTYNQARFLENAVLSVFQQTTLPFEIIISDDCSTDNTKEILQWLSTQIPILKVVRQPINLGINRNADACLRLAKGDLIVRLDSDDCLAPSYIELLSELLIKYPNAGYAHAAVQEINHLGENLNVRRLARKIEYQSSEASLKALIKGYRVAANIIMFRRDALERVDYISSHADFAEDYFLSASIAAAGFGNVYLNQVLSSYRVWVDNANIRSRRKLNEISGLRQVFEKALEPAFKLRDWDLKRLNRYKCNFACTHADCLGWKVFTLNEKKHLTEELFKLSFAPKVRLYIWLYLSGLGSLVELANKAETFVVSRFKRFYYSLQS